jgi:hypothetical protein
VGQDLEIPLLLTLSYRFTLDFARLNVDRIQQWIDQGRIDPSKPITLKELNATRCVHGIKDGIKLLARVRPFYLDSLSAFRPVQANTLVLCLER